MRNLGDTEVKMFQDHKQNLNNLKKISQSFFIRSQNQYKLMQQDSTEIVQPYVQLPPVGQENEGWEIVENEGMPQMSKQLKNKINQTATRFSEQLKGFRQVQNKIQSIDNLHEVEIFRQGHKNIFSIDKPHEVEIYQVLQLWKSRPGKNQKFLLHLELVDPKIPIELVKKMVEMTPSVMVHYGGIKLQNNGVLKTDGEYFYEGTEKVMNIFSESRQEQYEGEVMNYVKHGQGTLICRHKKNGFIYKGSFFEGKYNGKGELRNAKNIIYVGEFKNDYKHGEGVEMAMKRKKNQGNGQSGMVRKSIYTGQFQQGFRHGQGIEQTTHAIYDGQWLEGVKCGKGQIKYKNGDRYDGQWQNGEFHGKGTYEEKGNCTYTGNFAQGKYHGEGAMEYLNGDKFQGQFEKGKKHGKGIYTWADGDYYDGDWVKDSADGHGTSMIGTDFYDGEFKNGKKHGQGQLTNEQGDVIRAIWQNNQKTRELARNGEPV